MADPLVCSTGTITSYLAADPCQFIPGGQQVGPGAVKLLGFDSSFGVSPDQTNVRLRSLGAVEILEIYPDYASGLSWTGPGSVSVQLSFDLPQLPAGLSYYMAEEAVDGCCVETEFATDFGGGILTTSYTNSSMVLLPPDRDGRVLISVADWSYAFGSTVVSGESAGNPGQQSYDLQTIQIWLPYAQARTGYAPVPEPATCVLVCAGLLAAVLLKRR